MTELVTFVQMKEHLLVDHDEDNQKIQDIVEQASMIVLNHATHLADYIAEWQSVSPMDVPKDVQSAVLLVGGALYENRDGSTSGPQPLSAAVQALLTPNRDPALA
jgi:hypothetical protein